LKFIKTNHAIQPLPHLSIHHLSGFHVIPVVLTHKQLMYGAFNLIKSETSEISQLQQEEELAVAAAAAD
jgi:hypothetical protein